MIKNIYRTLLLLLQLFSFSTFAQNSEGDVELKIRNTKSVHSAIDANENYVFVFQSSSQLQYSFFTQAHQPNGNIAVTIPAAYKKDEVLAVQLNGDICTMYLHNEHKMTLSLIRMNRANGELSTISMAQLNSSDKFLKTFVINDVFYLLTVPVGSNQIDVWSVNSGVFEKTPYPVDMPSLYHYLSTGNDALNEKTKSTVGIDQISYQNENNVKSSHATKKIYAWRNNIYLTFDNPESTHLVTLDLDQKTATYKQLQFTLEKGNTSSKKQGNSFLYQNTLFRATMSTDQLNVGIIQLDSLQLLANYNAYPEFPINFKNGPILQEGSGDKHKIIEDNAAYFKKVLSGDLSISANLKDSLYILEIGGYEEQTSNNGYGPSGGGPTISVGMGMGMGMGMGGVGMGMGNMGYGGMGMGGYGMGMPGYYGGYPGYYPYNSTTTTIKTVYFHSMLDSTGMEHKAGIVPITMRERISNFQTTMFKDKTPELIRTIDRKNEILIGFLLTNSNIFRVYSFER